MLDRIFCLCTFALAVHGIALPQSNTALGVRAARLPRQEPSGAVPSSSGSASSTASASTPSATSGAPPVNLDVPSYVSQFAPLVYLHSQETYMPSLLQTHLDNVNPRINQTGQGIVPVANAPSPLTLANTNASVINNVYTYYTSDTTLDTPRTQQSWLLSDYGRPSQNKSAAPVITILVNKTGVPNQKPPGDLDVFYFYFYSYNLGPDVLGERFGNHVGDWEHSMVRFLDGQPQAIYLSTHSSGEAYTWSTLQKTGSRVVTYSAFGSHANYATPGNHDYSGTPIVQDYSDAGILWDPALNLATYWYSSNPDTFVPATGNTASPNFLYTVAKWGDQAYPATDPRQSVILGFQRFSDGPTGPIDKTLVRTGMSFDVSVQPATSLPTIVNGTTTPVQPANTKSGAPTILPGSVAIIVALLAAALAA